jgi:MarR family transcriptional regulator, organic hydroperoxide resistance regulator
MPPPASATIVLKRTPKIKERLNMKVNSELENLNLRLIRMVFKTYTRYKNCSDQVHKDQGLTNEQYLVLVSVKYHDGPVRITDVAQSVERSTNSVSMIVDRMVKAGLLRRVRDRSDRRVVNVFITSKAEDALKSANIAGRDLVRQITSPLSHEDARTFVSLFEMINYKLLEYLNPGADIDGMLKNDSERHDHLMKRWLK